MVVETRDFGEQRGTITFPVERSGETRGSRGRPRCGCPGCARASACSGACCASRAARRCSTPTATGSAARPPPAGSLAGLEAQYDERLGGRPGAELRYGRRVIAKVDVIPGRSVRTTIRPSLQTAATGALGDRVGGVAVVRPRNGDVLALAGLAVSGPQPPGSVFKIITLAAALKEGETKVGETFPVQTAATLEGVKLRNAGDESCGGTLTQSFAHSCNSVFGPLGARLGAKRLVRYAEAFGFNEDAADPGGSSRARSRTTSPTTSRSARARSARTATSRRRSRWRASARRSPTAACAGGRGSCAARRRGASAWSSAGSPARCAT